MPGRARPSVKAMRILLTGSSGWLGRHLAPRLRRDGHEVVGLDPMPGPDTTHRGSIADRACVVAAMAGIEAVIHAGALHKPHVATHAKGEFLAVNVEGTLHLLEAAVAQGVDRFVLTSTTSLMVDRALHEGRLDRAAWITEGMSRLEPRNIYGVSKLAAEHLARLIHETEGLPVVILRTARFFPEADDMAHAIEQDDANTKANELLFRRLTVEDAAEAHVAALAQAPSIGFDRFIVAAPTPFRPEDAQGLLHDAPAVVARYFPDYPAVYARLGWTMFRSIDRVYDAGRIEARLGFRCGTGFGQRLAQLRAG